MVNVGKYTIHGCYGKGSFCIDKMNGYTPEVLQFALKSDQNPQREVVLKPLRGCTMMSQEVRING